MKPDDFFKLCVGQEIWFDGQQTTITSLWKEEDKDSYIEFYINGTRITRIFSNILCNLSLTPPKQKKRYWLWNIKGLREAWAVCSLYLDDDGIATNERAEYGDWKIIEKQKLEQFWIEVEV